MLFSNALDSDALDDALDQLIENASILQSIADNDGLQEEKKALEDIQESLLHHLIHREAEVSKIKRSSFQSKIKALSHLNKELPSEKLRQYDIESSFRKRKILRKSRTKKALSSQ